MRRVAQYAVMAVLAGALAVSTTAQDWSATLVVDPFPSPYLSDWQQDPTLASLEIVNSGPKRDVVIVDAEIIAPDGERYLAHSKRLLVEPNLPVLIQSTDLTDWTVEGLSASARAQIRRTGLIPEGNGYQVCIEVRNLWDRILVTGVCAFFTIAHPDPPQLVYPLDSVEVYTPFPLLQWVPPTVPAGKQVIYSLRVAEILPGQTPRVAIQGNVPQYEDNSLLMSSIEYPPDALPLEEG
ncbi:MAG: hypothetical protein GF331_07665, partial [Chitinivibrionales bacterium]|nr:hypothetical protein [Chitinivibrionales bacterium]